MIKCIFCKTSVFDLREAERAGWDWFTGKLKKTVHVCPKCLQSRQQEVAQLREQAGVKP